MTEPTKMDEVDKLLFNEGCKPEPDEVLSFEEWYHKYRDSDDFYKPFPVNLEDAFKAARQGMIPAKNAIQLPEEIEWPSFAMGIVVQYQYDIDHYNIGQQPIKYIPRSKPKWTPEMGDKVVPWNNCNIPETVPIVEPFENLYAKYDHYAKVEQLSDIGHDIAWFKKNRDWI